MRRWLAIFFVGMFAGAAATYLTIRTHNADIPYLPQTDSEKALDTILMLDNRDRGEVFHFVLHHPWRDKTKDAFYKNLGAGLDKRFA